VTYPKVGDGAVPSSPKFPEIEERILEFWEKDATFQASIDQRDPGENGANEFVFYDGPPFANGLPHYGHLLTGYVKDLIPRYQTMRGKRVERRFGWDTHGLPAELEAMRLNGIKTTDEILELGIEKFNEACRASVMKYTGEWREYVTRQARWVDFDNDYRTMNPDYMESVIWAFKQLYDKGLVYEGFRVLPYCWNDETPLSNHELRMDDDVYQTRQDPAVTVGYEVTTEGPFQGVKLLVWTTTPWTLPSNLAVMVGEDIEYVVVSVDGVRYLLADARLSAYARELGVSTGSTTEFSVTWRGPGSELVGLTYTPPFSYYLGHENAFRVVPAEFVTTTDGTGLVHTAGAFGEDDKVVTDRENIEAVMPVGKDGRFTFPVVEYEGMLVFDANLHVIDHLKAATTGQGETGSVTPGTVLLRRETYDHSYPHCWRCREPLIYKGVSSWFVEVTAFKQRMLELNQQINWVPRPHQGRPVRQVARERPRLVDHPQPLLGQPGAGVEERRPDVPARRRLRLLRAARARLRHAAAQPGRPARPAPAVRRRPGAPQPRRPDRQVDDAPGLRRPRRVVRLRVDELRPGARAVRELRLVPAPFPGRLHRRVHRPDARLVLHAAHPRLGDLRQAGLRELHQPRHRARLRRQQDVEVAAQLPRRA